MQNSEINIKFNYEYRDAAGYRRTGHMVFINTSRIKDLESVESQLRQYLFDEEFFYPYKLTVPLIHFDNWNRELDHDWYRFDSLEFTEDKNTDQRTFDAFLSDLQKLAKKPII